MNVLNGCIISPMIRHILLYLQNVKWSKIWRLKKLLLVQFIFLYDCLHVFNAAPLVIFNFQLPIKKNNNNGCIELWTFLLCLVKVNINGYLKPWTFWLYLVKGKCGGKYIWENRKSNCLVGYKRVRLAIRVGGSCSCHVWLIC